MPRVQTPKPETDKLARKLARQQQWAAEMAQLPGVFVGVKLKNPLNSRQKWEAVSFPARRARASVSSHLTAFRFPKDLPCTIRMTRYGPRLMDEGCGNNAALKPVRDGTADYFGVKDNDPRIKWEYAQQVAPAYGVRVWFSPGVKAAG
jgi:hypothetical protein